jgi:hypothetical protein
MEKERQKEWTIGTNVKDFFPLLNTFKCGTYSDDDSKVYSKVNRR